MIAALAAFVQAASSVRQPDADVEPDCDDGLRLWRRVDAVAQ
jgi:hypothetical protein